MPEAAFHLLVQLFQPLQILRLPLFGELAAGVGQVQFPRFGASTRDLVTAKARASEPPGRSTGTE